MDKGFDAGMWIRRLILVVISLAVGVVVTHIIITAEIRFPSIIPIQDWMKLTPLTGQGKQFTLNTTYEDYGLRYTVLTILAFATAVAIWLDKFLNTKILPH